MSQIRDRTIFLPHWDDTFSYQYVFGFQLKSFSCEWRVKTTIYPLNIAWKTCYGLSMLLALHCTYLSTLCRALCSTAYVNVERAPICHWATRTSAKQYLVTYFNYRFAWVCMCSSRKLRSFVLSLFSSVSNPSAASLSLPLSFCPPLPLCFFFCPLVTCTVECLTLPNTLKMLSLPVGGKSFSSAMSLTWWPIYQIFLLPSTHTESMCSYQMQKSHRTINILKKC